MAVWGQGDRRYIPPLVPCGRALPCPDAFLYLRFTLGLEDVVNLRLGVRSWHRGPTLPSSGARRPGCRLLAFSDSSWAGLELGGWGVGIVPEGAAVSMSERLSEKSGKKAGTKLRKLNFTQSASVGAPGRPNHPPFIWSFTCQGCFLVPGGQKVKPK